MAADWIKLRCELQSHPKVVRILSATCTDKFRVIGGLHAVWTVFDAHSQDGVLPGYTPELMDHIIGWTGFSDAMIAVGWLAFDGDETLRMPEFTEHNGQSAKRRAEDQKRKRNSRHSVRNVSEESPKKTGLEKRREDNKPPISPKGEYSDEFEHFWSRYPRKTAKGRAYQAWQKLKPSQSLIAEILFSIERHKKSRDWIRDGGKFIPHPSTWLNEKRWGDEPEPSRSAGGFCA